MPEQRMNGTAHLAATPAPASAPDGLYVFKLEGEYWTIAYEGQLFRLKDAKGLRCVAHLLRHHGQLFQAEAMLVAAGIRQNGPGDDIEKARVAVTKRIRAAIAKIQLHHRGLAHHLTTSIKTGYACAYLPDPERPPAWSL